MIATRTLSCWWREAPLLEGVVVLTKSVPSGRSDRRGRAPGFGHIYAVAGVGLQLEVHRAVPEGGGSVSLVAQVDATVYMTWPGAGRRVARAPPRPRVGPG